MKLKTYECKKCGDNWEAPDESEVLWWEKLMSHKMDELPQVCALNWMTANTDFAAWQIKVIVSHFSFDSNKCCHCLSIIYKRGVVECRHCKGLNYNFKIPDHGSLVE